MAEQDTPGALDDFSVRAGIGQVIAMLTILHFDDDGTTIAFAETKTSPAQARELAADLRACGSRRAP